MFSDTLTEREADLMSRGADEQFLGDGDDSKKNDDPTHHEFTKGCKSLNLCKSEVA